MLVPSDLAAWLSTGQLKVALSVGSHKELAEFQVTAGSRGLPYFAVFDAGRTQIKAGAKSVLAIGPDLVDSIDKLCGHLALCE